MPVNVRQPVPTIIPVIVDERALLKVAVPGRLFERQCQFIGETHAERPMTQVVDCRLGTPSLTVRYIVHETIL